MSVNEEIYEKIRRDIGTSQTLEKLMADAIEEIAEFTGLSLDEVMAMNQ